MPNDRPMAVSGTPLIEGDSLLIARFTPVAIVFPDYSPTSSTSLTPGRCNGFAKVSTQIDFLRFRGGGLQSRQPSLTLSGTFLKY